MCSSDLFIVHWNLDCCQCTGIMMQQLGSEHYANIDSKREYPVVIQNDPDGSKRLMALEATNSLCRYLCSAGVILDVYLSTSWDSSSDHFKFLNQIQKISFFKIEMGNEVKSEMLGSKIRSSGNLLNLLINSKIVKFQIFEIKKNMFVFYLDFSQLLNSNDYHNIIPHPFSYSITIYSQTIFLSYSMY